MAYDEKLADRVREALGARDGLVEKKMFGGLAFMLRGNMCCGVLGDDLLVRASPDDADAWLDEPRVRLMDMTGRPMTGWLLVAPDETADPEGLRRWVERAVTFASALPPK